MAWFDIPSLDSSTVTSALGYGPKRTYQFVYSFPVNGGSQGTILLTQTNGVLPTNFVLMNSFVDVITPLGSAGLALAAMTTGQSANDLIVATAFSGAPFSTSGPKVTLPLIGTIATWIKMTGNRSPAIVVSVADLNAGKLNLFCEGYLSS